MSRRLSSRGRSLAALALAAAACGAAGPRAASAAELAEYLGVLKRGDAAQLAVMLRADRGRTPVGVRGASLLHLACSYHHASGRPARTRTRERRTGERRSSRRPTRSSRC